jgi:hypothetical protein
MGASLHWWGNKVYESISVVHYDVAETLIKWIRSLWQCGFGATAIQKRRGGESANDRRLSSRDILAIYLEALQNDSFAHPEAEHPFLMHTSYEHEERMLSVALAKLRSLHHHRDDFRDHANPMHLH